LFAVGHQGMCLKHVAMACHALKGWAQPNIMLAAGPTVTAEGIASHLTVIMSHQAPPTILG
jgi:hypothetical protein